MQAELQRLMFGCVPVGGSIGKRKLGSVLVLSAVEFKWRVCSLFQFVCRLSKIDENNTKRCWFWLQPRGTVGCGITKNVFLFCLVRGLTEVTKGRSASCG